MAWSLGMVYTLLKLAHNEALGVKLELDCYKRASSCHLLLGHVEDKLVRI